MRALRGAGRRGCPGPRGARIYSQPRVSATEHGVPPLAPALPTPLPATRRALRALVSSASRRISLGVGAVLALGAVGVVRGVAVAQGAALGVAASAGLDALAVVSAAALYLALAGSGERPGALRSLAVPFGFGLGVLALTLAVGASFEGHIDPKTGLPDRPLTVVWAAILGTSEAALGATVLASLRPLALHRRRRSTLWTWGAFLGLTVLSALTVAGRPLTVYVPTAMAVFGAAAVLAGVGIAIRQRWIGDLPSRQRVAAGTLALGLSVTLVALLAVQFDGPGALLVGDGTGRVPDFPYTVVLSRSLSALVLSVTVFGALYGLATTLHLLFGLSAAAVQDQRAGERRALRSLADLSGRVLDRAELAAAVARGPVDAGLADAAWVALTDPAHGNIRPVVVAAAGLPLEAAGRAADADALHRAASEADGALVLAHAEADHRVRARPGDGVASLVALSLGGPSADGPGGLTRGVLLVSRTASDAFEADDLAALETFAGQAALSLSHADLFADALERERLARELALAREVQQRLFPQSLPEVEGLELAAAERPAREVGGDYYDVVRIGDDCVGVMVADVSGKGAPAAFYMAELKGVFQAGSRLTRSPGELLAGANDALAPSLGRGVFASAVYAVVDAREGTLALARAGHTPAVLVRDRGRPDGGRWLLRGDGLAIGLDRAGATFRQTLREQCVRLAPGDTLVLYTDGLVEARDADGREYGYDRLATFVEAHAHVGALDLRDLLLAEHRAWSGSDEPDDDTTFVVVRWAGRGEDVPPADVSAGPPVTERAAFPVGPATPSPT